MAYTLGEYQDIFLEEADEQLQELNQNLLQLEQNPEEIEIINNIFRAAHSLKSSAAFVGLNGLSDLAHKMENLLQGIRDKTLNVTPDIVEVLFRCFDKITGVITTVASGKEPTEDLSGIIRDIERIGTGKVPGKKEAAAAPAAPAPAFKTEFNPEERRAIKRGLESGMSCCELTVFIDRSALMKSLKARLVISNLEHVSEVVKTLPDLESLGHDEEIDVFRVILLSDSSVEEIRKACDLDQITRVDMREISLKQQDDKLILRFHNTETLAEEKEEDAPALPGAPAAMEDKRSDTADAEAQDDDEDEPEKSADVGARVDKRVGMLKTVKVSVDKLDQLLNNVGELVISNSGFYKLYEELRKRSFDKSIINEFKNRMEQMSRIAKDLQSGIMKTRMVPIGGVFTRFQRLVRDLNIEFGKKVQLKIVGEETELDKKVIDAIGEPLMHLIRNAIDHGIEETEARKKYAKPDVATVTLNAYQGGNQIFVEVSDDGRGLNVDEIKRSAVKNNLATPEMVANMDNEDIYNFIFNPGFSTKQVVTDISGRGVGMNVVKEIVSELNGNVTIETEPGMGTRFVMAFPLTLAIIPAIMVKVGREMYAIPLSDVIETIKISTSDIQTIEGHEVINLRGEILSLLRLNRFVRAKSALGPDQKIPVVVVGYGNRKIGLMVDFLEGKQEIVIKSLEQNYRTVEGLAGASILGDGSICLILDISSMMNKVITEQETLSDRDRKRLREGDFIEEADYEEAVLEGPVSAAASATGAREEYRAMSAEKPTVAERTVWEKPSPPSVERTGERAESVKAEKGHARPSVSETPSVAAELDDEEDFKIISEDMPPIADTETPVVGREDEEIEKRVKDALHKFKDELRENVQGAMEGARPYDHLKEALQMDDDDLDGVRVLANLGITHAAENLSKILNKQIDLTIPDVRFIRIDKIPETIGSIDSVYIGVYMPLQGDINGTILFSFIEENGFDLIDTLWGTETGKTRELTEDGESALKELGNIVGSSVINVIAEKINMAIKPTVPTVTHDYMQATLDSILVMHSIKNDYALIMETDFFYGDDRVIGNMLVLPDTESLKLIVDKLKQ